jgi:copper chaperone
MKHIIEVTNIKCDGCVSSIKNALAKLDTVADVSVDKASQTVTVEAETDRTVLLHTLAGIGYPEKVK